MSPLKVVKIYRAPADFACAPIRRNKTRTKCNILYREINTYKIFNSGTIFFVVLMKLDMDL